MKRRKLSLNLIGGTLLFLSTLAGCSRVNTDSDSSANLGSYKSYSWKQADVKTDNPIYKGDLIDNTIKGNVEKELAQKGLIHNDQSPDFYVMYHTFTEDKQGTTGGNYGYPPAYGFSSTYGPMGYGPIGYGIGYGGPYTMGYGGYSGFGSAYGYGGGYAPSTYSYTEETLILDFIDAKTNKVVWRGSIANDVTDVSQLDKQLEKGVHAIMKKYPDGHDHHMVKHSM